MQSEKFILKFSKINRRYFLIIFFAAIFSLHQTTAAQSGRKLTAAVSPVEQSVEIKAEKDLPTDKKAALVSALKITGDIQYDSGFNRSNYLGIALKECVNNLKGRPSRPLEVVKEGGMRLNDAKELAKKETEAHVLWMGFFVKNNSYGGTFVEYVDYAVMMPQTAKILTYGRIELGQPNMGNTGTVLQIPTSRTSTSQLLQLKQGSREIANILKRGGWLD